MSRYAKGAAAERELKKILEAKGYTVIRSAGSKGAFDLLAFNPMHVKAIQVKASKENLTQAVKKMALTKTPVSWSKEIWVREKGGVWKYNVVISASV